MKSASASGTTTGKSWSMVYLVWWWRLVELVHDAPGVVVEAGAPEGGEGGAGLQEAHRQGEGGGRQLAGRYVAQAVDAEAQLDDVLGEGVGGGVHAAGLAGAAEEVEGQRAAEVKPGGERHSASPTPTTYLSTESTLISILRMSFSV